MLKISRITGFKTNSMKIYHNCSVKHLKKYIGECKHQFELYEVKLTWLKQSANHVVLNGKTLTTCTVVTMAKTKTQTCHTFMKVIVSIRL